MLVHFLQDAPGLSLRDVGSGEVVLLGGGKGWLVRLRSHFLIQVLQIETKHVS